MKELWIALAVFSLMIALIAVSTWYGRHVCDELQRMTEALPDTPEENSAMQAAALCDYWQRQMPWLRPIVNRTVVRSMSDLISDLSIYADPDIDALIEYRSTKQKLLGAIDEMRRAEQVMFGIWS